MKLWLEDNLGSRKALIQRALLFSGVTLFVLFLFQPFGTNNDISSYKYLRLSGYGLVTFCALLLSGAIEIGFARRRWSNTLRRMIIPSLYIVILAVFNHSYMVVAFLGSWHWQNQLLFVFYTLAIGLFPITFMVLVNRHSANIIAPQQVHIPETQTDSSNVTAISHTLKTKLITLTGDNKDDKIQVSLSQILFIKSADNYCELAILEDNIYSRQLLRCSLTSLLKQLPSNSQVFRCHRSYVVNLMLVESFTGNAGGLQLSMKSLDVMVPVSRSYVDAIKQALQLVPIAC